MIKSLNKALDIIECFYESDRLFFSDFCKKTNMPNGTISRILKTFIERGYIQKNKKTGTYTLGDKIFILGFLIFKNFDFAQIVKSVLEDITLKTGETSNASILFENSVVFIDTVEGKYSVKMAAKLGRKNYINVSASGKALLAYLDNDLVNEILSKAELPKITENTITDREIFKKELEQVCVNGYAIDNEEEEIGLKCIAGAVFNQNGKVVGAISISGPKSRIENNLENFIEIIKYCCREASKKLGYYINPNINNIS